MEAQSVVKDKNNGRILVISRTETEKIHEDAERLLSASWELLRDANLFFTQIEKAGRHGRLRTASWALLRAAGALFSKAEALHELIEQELDSSQLPGSVASGVTELPGARLRVTDR